MIGPIPMCAKCKHLHPDDDKPMGQPPTCDAFPAGIPDAIYTEGVDHRKPFPGDNGIHFAPKP